MKTVSTKLDSKSHEKFLELCKNDGKCQSEFLRDIIETLCEDCSEYVPKNQKDLEINVEDIEPKPEVRFI